MYRNIVSIDATNALTIGEWPSWLTPDRWEIPSYSSEDSLGKSNYVPRPREAIYRERYNYIIKHRLKSKITQSDR